MKELFQDVKEKDCIVVATSGGPDSMFLLTSLLKIRQEKQLTIICAHVNHKTRKACEQEALFVKQYCAENHIPYEQMEIEKYQKNRFSESEARSIRIDYFVTLAKKYHANYVMTAHHGDDLVETILMKLMRGSTLDAIPGIKVHQYIQDVDFYRPLLTMSKEAILEKLKEENISYCIDESNEEDDHLRNRIRHQILPALKKEDKNIHKKFLKFSEELTETCSMLEKKVIFLEKDLLESQEIKTNSFLELPTFYQKKFLERYLKKQYKTTTKINVGLIEIIITYLKKQTRKNWLDLSEKMILVKTKDTFYVTKKTEQPSYWLEAKDEVDLKNGYILKKMNTYQEKSNYEIHLNSQKIKLPLYITTRKPGMIMKVKNLGGSKKVKDILIDEKIPVTEKNKIPILVDSENTVLWILGIKKSEYDLEKNENYDIIYQYQKKGTEK